MSSAPMDMDGPGRTGRGEQFFRFNLWLKGFLAVAKTAGGIFTGSGSLLADGWHNLSDLLTGAVAWASFRYAARPPDADHHYGHGNAEAAAGVLVGVVLLLTGAGVLWQAYAWKTAIRHGVPAAVALGLALVSIVVNEILARRSFQLGRELSSHGLVALARDDRADSLSSVLVIVGIGGALLGWRWAETLVTAVIGVWILVMGVKSAAEGFDVLMDRVADPSLQKRIRTLAGRVEGVVGVQAVRIHPLGSHERVDMEISVDRRLTVEEGHRIAHAVEQAVRQSVDRVTEVHVHVNPG